MTGDFRIWIDADSCPQEVRDIVIRAAKKNSITTFFVANREIGHPKNGLFTMVVTGSAKDAADNYIVEHCAENDLVITRDILLAQRLLAVKATVLNDRGALFTQDSINERLSIRNFNLELYQNGLVGDKTRMYGKKEAQAFANCFDRELQKKLRHRNAAEQNG